MRGTRVAAAAAMCAALTGCGSAAQPLETRASDRAWAANVRSVIRILERDLLLSTTGGATVAAARHSLRDISTLYTILVAYTDFGGCSHMVASAGPPPRRFSTTDEELQAACVPLERASALFNRAASASNPKTLLAATRTALKGSPPLQQAIADLQAATASRKS